MWRYVGRGSFISGIESRDYDDAEFEAVAKTYEADNGFPAGSLAASLLWEHQPDKPSKNGGAKSAANEEE